MTLEIAKCPNCGGELQLPNNKIEATCIYCDTKIIVSEAIKAKGKDIEPLLKLMQDAFEAEGDGTELLKYANKVLEIDSSQALAMFYKGMANCWMYQIPQGIVFINKAIKLNTSNEFKIDVYNIILEWSEQEFDHFYYHWNVQPGSDMHCDNKRSRFQYGEGMLDELDNNYNINTSEVIELVECGINILPEKSEGHKLIIEKLKKVSFIDWSEVIAEHKNSLKALGHDVPHDVPSTSSKGPCFIATAAMGSYDHPVVMDLRLFRDNWLLKRNWGVAFTKWYYTYGPKAARVIEKSVVLKRLAYIIIVKPLQLVTRYFK